MPTVSKVTLLKEQACDKCKGKLSVGDIAVKDRRNKKTSGKTIYYHTQCPKEAK